jgi:hypothetical protein
MTKVMSILVNLISCFTIFKKLYKKNVAVKLVANLIIVTFFLSCSKNNNNNVYDGEVIRQPNYCTASTGFPFIIQFTNQENDVDSLITTTLPSQYKFIGQKIKFEFRDLNPFDERLACSTLFSIPKQKFIFNVENQ